MPIPGSRYRSFRAATQGGRRSSGPFLAALVTLASCTLASASASAQAQGVSIQDASPAQKKEAQAHYEAGAKLFEQKQFAMALTAFEASYGVVRSPNAHLMLGRTLAELGRAPRAYQELLLAHDEAKANEKYAATLEKIREHLAQLKGKVALVRVKVKDGSGAYVARIGGEDVPVDVERAFAPGPLSVTLLEAGAVKASKEIVAVAGEQTTVELTVEPEPSVVLPPPPPPVLPRPVPSTGDDSLSFIVAGSVVGGAGLIGLGVGTGLYFTAKSDYDELIAVCGSGAGSCPEGSQQQIDAGQEKQAGAIISWVAGGVTAGVGVGLLIAGITAPTKRADDAPVVTVGPGSISITSRF